MIRESTNKDIDNIMHIWFEATVYAHSFINPNYWADKDEVVRNEYLPKAKTYVYEEDEEIKGFISILDNNLIGAVFVDVKHQMEGIGTKLMNFVINIYPELCLNVYMKNYNAVRFYKKMGFEVINKKFDEDTNELEYEMSNKKSLR